MLRRVPAGRIIVVFALWIAGLPVTANAQKYQIPTTPTTQPGSNPPARRLTLAEAVNLALTNSKTMRVAAEAVAKARGFVNENKAGFMPSLNSTTNFTHLDRGSTVTFPGPTGEPETIPIVKQDQKTVTVQALLPVDISGLIRTAVEASQFQEVAARLDYNRTRNQLVLDVHNAYYNVLRARAFVTVAETALKNAQDQQATAEAFLRAGTGTRFDVLRAETAVANAQQALISARNQVNLATASLNNVLNLDQNTPLETVDTQEPLEAQKDFNGAVTEAYQTRPEVLQADANIRAAEKGVALARRSSLPTLGVSWNFQYAPDQGGFAPRETSWVAMAQVTLPLFDQGVSRARVQQAKAGVNTAKLGKQQVLDGIALDVRQSYLSLVEAQERVKVAEAALAQAEEQYRLAQVRFRAGVTQVPGGSPLLEVSDALTALTQTQNNAVNARYDAQNAQAQLDRAIGRYAYGANVSPGMPSPTMGGKK